MKEPKPSEYASVVLQSDDNQPSERIQSDIVIIHSTDHTINEAELHANTLSQTRRKIRCLLAIILISAIAALLLVSQLTIIKTSETKTDLPKSTDTELLSTQPVREFSSNTSSKAQDKHQDIPINSPTNDDPPRNVTIITPPIVIPAEKEVEPKNPSVNEREHVYDCFAEENLAHYYDPNQNIMYYRTTYDIFMPTCFHAWETILGHQDMEKWERERQVIEWARRNVRRGDSVFYDCQGCRNFLDIVMLSLFVGAQGRLYIGQQMRSDICFPRIKLLHELNNVEYLNRNQQQERKYNVLISKNQASFRNRNLNEDVSSSPPLIILVKLGANSDLLNPLISNQEVTTRRVTLNSSDCRSTIIERPINGDFREGYFSIVRNDYKPRKEEDVSSKRQNPALLKYRKQYQQYRPTVPSPSEKKDITKIHQTFPIKLSQLSTMSEQEGKQWLSEKEIVEWVRNRTNTSAKVYYQYHPDRVNLFAVLNIASMVSQGQLDIHCSDQSWARIASHTQSLGLRNIRRADRLSDELLSSCQLFITDSLDNVRAITKEGNFGNKLLLGYFTEDISESKELLYRLYPHYHIRKVGIRPSFYYGYQIFDNFFWHCEHPKGFFEIQAKTYVIFTFWIQAISQMTPGRRYDIQEMVRMNTPEIKVINLIVLPYFIPEDQPFHKAYEFLSVVHKSDYLRCYFLYVYGGGYHDMKHIHYDMITYFKKLEEGPSDMYAYGFRFMTYIFPPCLNGPKDPPCNQIVKNQFNLLGAQVQIHKYRNPIITSYFQKVHRILDEKYESLKRNPAGHPRDRIGFSFMQNGRMVSSGYPLRWQQICAQAYRNAQLQNFQHYYMDMPFIIMSDYK